MTDKKGHAQASSPDSPNSPQPVPGYPLSRRDMPIGQIDTDARTIECTWTTGAQVMRYDWAFERVYLEELSADPAHVNLGRLQSGNAPVLSVHHAWSLSDVLGVVMSAGMNTDGTGHATLRFSSRPDVEPVWRDITERILRNVSVAARINAYEMIPPGAEGNEFWIYRAIDWEPYEISVVPVGADADAVLRAIQAGERPEAPKQVFPCRTTQRAGTPCVTPVTPATSATARTTMNENETSQPQGTTPATTAIAAVNPPAAAPAVTHVTQRTLAPEPVAVAATATPAAPIDDAQRSAVIDERRRIGDIRTAVRAALQCGLPGDAEQLAQGFVDSGASAETARAEMMNRLVERSATLNVQQGARIDVTDNMQRQEAVVNALMHRVNPQVTLTEQGRLYRGYTLRELCRQSLEESGISTRGMSVRDIAGIALGVTQRAGYHATGDLPLIFGSVIARTLRAAYQAAPKTFTSWARQTTIGDFRPVTRAVFDGMMKFEKINEAGEYKYGQLIEGGETYKLATYGKIIGFTRQMIINDDLSALERIPQLFGTYAAEHESNIVYEILTGNPKMADGRPVFDAAHKNVGEAASIDIDAMSEGRRAMRTQTSPGGVVMNLAPSILLVPSALETRAWQMTSAGYTPTEAGKQNPFVSALTPVVEPRLDAVDPDTWYLMTSPGRIDTVEYAYLEGEAGIYTEQQVGFEVDGLQVKARLDFAAKCLDWRGMYRVSKPAAKR